MKTFSKIGFLSILFGLSFTLIGCDSNQNHEVVNEPTNDTTIENIDVGLENTNDVVVNVEELTTDIEKENPTLDPSYTLRTQEDISMPEPTEEQTEQKDDILVVYFSRADENYSVGMVDKGNTKFLAEYIANYTNADTFEIVPVVPYPVDYDETTKLATKEKDENARPEYKGNVSNWDDYEVVFLGYPIWWGDLPMIVYTFLDNHNFAGKKVYLFNTHEGSGNSGTYSALKRLLSSADVNTDGLTMRGADARKDSAKATTENWLQGLGF